MQHKQIEQKFESGIRMSDFKYHEQISNVDVILVVDLNLNVVKFETYYNLDILVLATS